MDSKSQLQQRQKYVTDFNSTMIKIWKEKIILLDAVDTASLYNSVVAVSMQADGLFLDIRLAQRFNVYGFYVNYGTGREVYRGNPGDIGKNPDGSSNGRTAKNRKAKPWFSKKYYASVMNLQEFFADNVGRQGAMVIAEALNADKVRAALNP